MSSSGVAAAGLERRHVTGVAVEGHLLHATRVAVEHDELPALVLQRPADGLAGLAVADHEHERGLQSPDPPAEPLQRDRVAEGALLGDREEDGEGVAPRQHADVDRQRDPHPLGVGVGVRDLAVTDRQPGVADDVEGVEDAERLRVLHGAGHDREPEGHQSERADEDDEHPDDDDDRKPGTPALTRRLLTHVPRVANRRRQEDGASAGPFPRNRPALARISCCREATCAPARRRRGAPARCG